MYFVYILRCCDGSYYVGITDDPQARVALHNAGRGPRYTALRQPVELACAEPFEDMQQARRRELQIKKWTRAKKEALKASAPTALKRLSRCRSVHGQP